MLDNIDIGKSSDLECWYFSLNNYLYIFQFSFSELFIDETR